MAAKSEAKLVQHKPGEIVVVDIPLTVFQGFDNDFSLKSILKAVAPPKTRAPLSAASTSTALTNEHDSGGKQQAGGRDVNMCGQGMGSFAKFIEEMERKYTNQLVGIGSSSDDEDDEDSSNEGDDGDDSVDAAMQNGADESEDSDDSSSVDPDGGKVLDLSKNIAECTKEEKKKKRRKHEFYAYDDSMGALLVDDTEVAAVVDMAVTAKKKKTKTSGFFQAGAGELDLVAEPAAPGSARPSASAKQQQLGSAGSKNKTGSAGGVGGAGEESSVSPSKQRPPAVKQQWAPTPAIISALQNFKHTVLSLRGLTLPLPRGEPLPVQLDAPLQALDSIVRAELGEQQLARIIGYHEAVAQALGGEVVPARIGALLRMLHQVRETAKLKDLVNSSLASLKEGLKSRISPYSGPPPGAAATAAAAAATPGNPDSTSPRKTPADKDKDMDKEKDEDETKYTHQIRWDVASRTLLLALESALERWVDSHNSTIDARRAAERTIEGDLDSVALDKTAEFTGLLTYLISSCAFAAIKGGDIQSLRRRMTEEKQRLRRIKKDEEKRASEAAAAVSAAQRWGTGELGSGLDIPGLGLTTPQVSFAPSLTQSKSSTAGKKSNPRDPQATKPKPKLVTTGTHPSGGVAVGGDSVSAPAKKSRSNPSSKKRTEPVLGSDYPKKKVFDAKDFIEDALPAAVTVASAEAEAEAEAVDDADDAMAVAGTTGASTLESESMSMAPADETHQGLSTQIETTAEATQMSDSVPRTLGDSDDDEDGGD